MRLTIAVLLVSTIAAQADMTMQPCAEGKVCSTSVELVNLGHNGPVCSGIHEHTAKLVWIEGEEIVGNANRYLTGIGYYIYTPGITLHYARFYLANKDAEPYTFIREIEQYGYGKIDGDSNWPKRDSKPMRLAFPADHYIAIKYKCTSTSPYGTGVFGSISVILSHVEDSSQAVNQTQCRKVANYSSQGETLINYGVFGDHITSAVPAGYTPHCLWHFAGSVGLPTAQTLPLWYSPEGTNDAYDILGSFVYNSTFQPGMNVPVSIMYIMHGGCNDPCAWAGYGSNSARHNILGGVAPYPQPPGYTDGHHYVLDNPYGVNVHGLEMGAFVMQASSVLQ